MTFGLKGIVYVTAAFALAFALAPVDSARADVVWNYQGASFSNAHDPFTTSNKVTGTLTFATPLAANLNLADESAATFSFTITATDANGCMGSHAYTVTVAP